MGLIRAAADENEDPLIDFLEIFVWFWGHWGRAREATVPNSVVEDLHRMPAVSFLAMVIDHINYNFGGT